MISQCKVKTAIPNLLYTTNLFSLLQMGGGGITIYVDMKFNLNKNNKVDISFLKAKDTFWVTEFKEKVFCI